MVNKSARRTHRMSAERLAQHLNLKDVVDEANDEESFDVEDPEQFMEMLNTWEHSYRKSEPTAPPVPRDDRPIYLLRSIVHRSEIQNQLTFQAKTSLDTRATATLAAEYTSVAKELESILMLVDPETTEDVPEIASLAGFAAA
jgi:hypothetical protein